MDKPARFLLILTILALARVSVAGVYDRGSGSASGNGGGVNNGNYHGLSNANGNVGFNRRATYLAGQNGQTGQQQQQPTAAGTNPALINGVGYHQRMSQAAPPSSGLSAWGIITIIVMVILLGFCGYYGIICYPLFFDKDVNRFHHMDVSTTTTTSSPTRSTEFGKIEYDDEEYHHHHHQYPKMTKEQWAAEQ